MSNGQWPLDPLGYGHVSSLGHVSASQRVQWHWPLDTGSTLGKKTSFHLSCYSSLLEYTHLTPGIRAFYLVKIVFCLGMVIGMEMKFQNQYFFFFFWSFNL